MKINYTVTPIDKKNDENKLENIHNAIRQRKKYLFYKQQQLEKNCQHNHYLNTLLEDIKHYNDYITLEKKQQINALNNLKKYLYNLRIKEKLTEEQLNQANLHENQIINEIDNITKKLDKITNNVKSVKTII